MDKQFVGNRITDLRLKKDISEYQMSLDLGKNKSYIQGISSGRSMPSMKQFLEICDYFEITPVEFFNMEEKESLIMRKALDLVKGLSKEDIEAIIPVLQRLKKNSAHEKSHEKQIGP